MRTTAYDSLETIPADAAACFRYAVTGNFFLSLEWFQCLDATVMKGLQRARVYVLSDDAGEPLGLATFCHSRSGGILSSLTNYYTAEYRPVICADADVEPNLITTLVSSLAVERPRWHTLELDYLRTDRADVDATADALRERGFMVMRARRYENWFFPTHGLDFQSYFAGRSSQMKNTMARKEKKLRKAHHVDIQIHRTRGSDLDRAVADYVAVYNSSWKRPEPHSAFIPTLIDTCATLGILRLGILYVDSAPAAAQLWITHGGTALIYKLAYDERFAEFSVGSILSRELFKLALDEDRVREIDYGVGSEPYKKDWMTEVRFFERVTALNLRSPAGLGLASTEIARRCARQVLRPFRRTATP